VAHRRTVPSQFDASVRTVAVAGGSGSIEVPQGLGSSAHCFPGLASQQIFPLHGQDVACVFRKHPGGTGQRFVLRTAPPGRATCEDIRPHVVRKLSLHPCDDCAHLVEMSKIRCGIHRAHVVLPGHRVAIAGQHVQTELFVEMSGRRRRCGQCGQHRVVVGIELVGASIGGASARTLGAPRKPSGGWRLA
jgi:hypothetical protein